MGFLEKLFGAKPQEEEVEVEVFVPIDEFQPENELEDVLKRAVTGQAEMGLFLDTLLRSRLFVPSPDEVRMTPDGPSGPFRPLVFEHPQHGRMVAVFTAGSRTARAQPLFPQLKSGIETDARWVLSMVPDGLGMHVNPGWQVGLEMPAEGLARMKADLGLVRPG